MDPNDDRLLPLDDHNPNCNEKSSDDSKSSKTRKVNIEYTTRFDASEEFGGIENVPKEAISMGIKTILKAKRIVLVAWGDQKAKVIKKAV